MKNPIHVFMNKFRGKEYARRRLEKIEAAVASVPEGKHLLKLAKALGVTIQMHPLRKEFQAIGLYQHDRQGIWLDQDTSTHRLVTTLFHELRHMWQHMHLEHPDNEKSLSLGAAVGFVRLLEGDAYAFEKSMELRLKGKEATPEKYAEYFWKFQDGLRATAYGSRVAKHFNDRAKTRLKDIDQDARVSAVRSLKDEFNIRSFGEIGGLEGITRAGFGSKAPSYVAVSGAQELQEKILEKASTLEKLFAVAYHKTLQDDPQQQAKSGAPRKRRSLGKALKVVRAVSKMGAEVFDRYPEALGR